MGNERGKKRVEKGGPLKGRQNIKSECVGILNSTIEAFGGIDDCWKYPRENGEKHI